MIVVRNTLTGRALAVTNRYKGLQTTTTVEAGFETLTVQVEASAVNTQADRQWQGHEILVMAREGTVWEGVIEQVQVAQGYFNIFAVGMGLWELSASSLYGVYFHNALADWKPIQTENIYYIKTGFTTESNEQHIRLGANQNTLMIMGSRYGVEYVTPFADTTYGNFKYLSIRYRRAAVPTTTDDAGTGPGGDFAFIVAGIDSAGAETQLLNVPITATDGTSVPFVWYTGAAGFESFQFMIQKTTTDGKVTDPDLTLVEISQIEISLMSEAPTIKNTIVHIIGRLDKTFAHRETEYPTNFLSRPVIADGKPDAGMNTLRELVAQARRWTGEAYMFGTLEGYAFHLHAHTRSNYLITEKDAGEDALYSLVRQSPSVGGRSDGVVTHVRAHYTDSEGRGRFTDLYPTTLVAPRTRIETIDASSDLNADGEAEARAAEHAEHSPRGSFSVAHTIKTLSGRFVPVSQVRAGDWVELNTVSISGRLDTPDFRRGGMIGKTSYNGDADEVSIELLGNT